MGLATKHIRTNGPVIEAQLVTGCESDSDRRDAFSCTMGSDPKKREQQIVLKASWIDTPLGPMIAISNETGLYLLEFVERRSLEHEIEKLRIKTKTTINPGTTNPIISIKKELQAYFSGRLKEFKTPIHLMGTPFQKLVWETLMKIPYGQTISYAAEALMLEKPASACRAVANANGANKLAIIIPCHRVINANGQLGGYGAGIMRKKWLLDFER